MKLTVTEQWEMEAASIEAARFVLALTGKVVQVEEVNDGQNG